MKNMTQEMPNQPSQESPESKWNLKDVSLRGIYELAAEYLPGLADLDLAEFEEEMRKRYKNVGNTLDALEEALASGNLREGADPEELKKELDQIRF